MEDIITDIIKSIMLEREVQNKAPIHATMFEIQKEVYSRMCAALSNMEIKGIIETGRTINDRWVVLKNQTNNE